MNITFLIGNGFDLNLGLKTTYKDFLAHYTADQENDSELIKKFKQDIQSFPALWSNVELALGKYTEQFEGSQGAKDYLTCFQDIQDKLGDYLENIFEYEDFYSIADYAAGIFAEALFNYRVGFRPAPRDKLINSQININEGYKFNFINFNYTSSLDLFVEHSDGDKIYTKFKRASSTAAHKIYIPHHVHGLAFDEMVLGVDNTQQISNTKLFEESPSYYINRIIKPQINNIYENNTNGEILKLINSSHLFYIYGMAIGETDATWWKAVAQRMLNHQNICTIIYVHEFPSRKNLIEYQDRIDKAKELLLSHSRLENSIKETLKERIFIAEFNMFEKLQNLATEEGLEKIRKQASNS